MGRHGNAGAPGPTGEPGPPGTSQPPPGRAARLRASWRPLAERLVLGAITGAAAMLVLAWAGTRWRTAAALGAATGCLVIAAAWLAATVPETPRAPEPGPHEPPGPGRPAG